MTLSFILCVLGSYLLGSLPTGLLIARCYATDIRTQGSGNIGAANVARVLGYGQGVLTLCGDMLKGFLPAWCGITFFHSTTAACILGAAAFAGHLFPVYLKFRGGKGVATCCGVLLCLAPAVTVVAAVLFVLIVGLSRYVAVGSLTCAVLMPVALTAYAFPLPVVLLSICMGLCIVLRHKDNIRRLLHGRENKIPPLSLGKKNSSC